MDLKLTNSVLKRDMFTIWNSKGPQTKMLLTYQDLQEIIVIYCAGLRADIIWICYTALMNPKKDGMAVRDHVTPLYRSGRVGVQAY